MVEQILNMYHTGLSIDYITNYIYKYSLKNSNLIYGTYFTKKLSKNDINKFVIKVIVNDLKGVPTSPYGFYI